VQCALCLSKGACRSSESDFHRVFPNVDESHCCHLLLIYFTFPIGTPKGLS
jgi:hypothetical protein